MVDCKMKCSSFIGSVNRVMANFGHLQSHIFSQIFKTHCCTFCGSALWYLILKVLLKFVLLGIKVFYFKAAHQSANLFIGPFTEPAEYS